MYLAHGRADGLAQDKGGAEEGIEEDRNAQDKSARCGEVRKTNPAGQGVVQDKGQANIRAIAQGYIMQDGELWRRSPRRKVIWKDEELRTILSDFHIDLGHYGRHTTARAVKEMYEVARDLWEDALTMLCTLSTLQERQHATQRGNPSLWTTTTLWVLGDRLYWPPLKPPGTSNGCRKPLQNGSERAIEARGKHRQRRKSITRSGRRHAMCWRHRLVGSQHPLIDMPNWPQGGTK
jgi:hypothetical protein